MLKNVVASLFLTLMTIAPAIVLAQEPTAPASKPASRAEVGIVNLNSASQAELEALPGIGPKMAQRILEYRQKNGSFKKIEDLMNVKGIGEKSFLKLKAHLTVAAAK